jgi:hypothetical protein
MNCINCRVVRTALVFFAGLIAASITNAQSSPKPQASSAPIASNVNVVNTPSVNVKTMPAVTLSGTPTVNVGSLPPVTGSVSITNSPSVTGTVNIGNSPTVQVGNTKSSPANALDVERAARIPYESSQQSIGYPQETSTFPAAPSGYRLVLQHVSCTFLMNSGATQLPLVTLYTNDGSYTARASFMGQLGGIGSNTYGAVNTDILSYWDPANGQPLVIANGDFYPSVVNFVTLSGYLENCSVTGCPAVQR